MGFLLAAFVLIGQILLGMLAVAVILALLFVALPTRARVAGNVKAGGDFEAFLNGEGSAAVGGLADEETVVTVTWDVDVSARLLGGAVGIEYATETGSRLSVLGMRFGVPRKSEDKGKAQKSLKADAKQRGRNKKSKSLSLYEAKAWLAPTVRKRAMTDIKALTRAVHFQGNVGAELGLPDPGVTGMANAAYLVWSGATNQKWLSFRPNFVENVVSVHVDGSTRTVAAQVIWIIGRFLLSRDIRLLWRKKRAGESKKAPLLGAHTTG